MVGADAATIRLLTPDKRMRLISSIGMADEKIEKKGVIPVTNSLCGKAMAGETILYQENPCDCQDEDGVDISCTNNGVIIVPLQHQNRTLGVYTLFVPLKQQNISVEMDRLLLNIGQNLGMAIEKFRLERKAQQNQLDQERTHIAHELHDSLAQTLASLRIRTQLISEEIESVSTKSKISHLKHGIYQANRELRSLISNFRAPINNQRLIPAIKSLSDKFNQETGINIYFQHHSKEMNIDPEREGHIIRVIQESLTNIRKHSQAKTVRILAELTDGAQFRILIEDDGVGFFPDEKEPIDGEHIGLSAMEQRMKSKIEIDSEPGDGTHITITGSINNEDIFNIL